MTVDSSKPGQLHQQATCYVYVLRLRSILLKLSNAMYHVSATHTRGDGHDASPGALHTAVYATHLNVRERYASRTRNAQQKLDASRGALRREPALCSGRRAGPPRVPTPHLPLRPTLVTSRRTDASLATQTRAPLTTHRVYVRGVPIQTPQNALTQQASFMAGSRLTRFSHDPRGKALFTPVVACATCGSAQANG